MDFGDPSAINVSSLASLLQESKTFAELREQETAPPISSGVTKVTTGSGLAGRSKVTTEEEAEKKRAEAMAIWTDDEIKNEEDIIDLHDRRPAPRYELFYKQTVGSEDVFLGMNDKTPSSSDCTHLVVKIHFPGSRMADLDLDVTRNRIKASSASLKLFTYLPVDVDSEKGSAKFDAKKEVLSVTLPIIQE